ncbi:hypothetical protein Gohar_009840 [Gossypium harknessii]|uniref:RNase H type-1 domain-containing protein n=1 Tax=Gossypium harknessii TaxID=34285 RepID=A0A7J9GP06_9ROSI|nr:hypothetical protein [Gossypium harknessii]
MGVSWTRNYVRMLTPVLHVNPMVTAMQWSALNKGWSKLNTNGAVSLNGSYVAIGGVIRDANLEIECDNALLVETIVASGAADSKMLELHTIHRMIHLNWKVCIHHIPRAHNVVADHMTKVTAIRFTETQEFEEPPCSMQDLVHADYIGCIRN